MFSVADADVPEVELSDQRIAQMLGDIKRNSRNRRIAMFAPVILAAAVVSAMIAAPPQHGGLGLVAEADGSDPELPRVFGSNGVWRLAEPIAATATATAADDAAGAASVTGPASVVEAPIAPEAPTYRLTPPRPEDLISQDPTSLPTSTSTPPTSTSGQSQDAPDAAVEAASVASVADEPVDPADLDWSQFGAVIRIEPESSDAAESSESSDTAETVETAETELSAPDSSPDPLALAEDDTTTPDNSSLDEDVTVAVPPQTEQDGVRAEDPAEANPSTLLADPSDTESLVFSTPATIVPQSVLVYSAHVSVTVQVVDDDSSVIDWCHTRVDWGDGSVSRVAGVDDAALCTASCEYEALSSTPGAVADADAGELGVAIDQSIEFTHSYSASIDASPRIFVATGDGCSYTLAELQLAPFTVFVSSLTPGS